VLSTSMRRAPPSLPILQKDPTLDVTALTLAQAFSAAAQNPSPDVFVTPTTLQRADDGFQLITNLRSQSDTKTAAILAIVPENGSEAVARALDYGANDVIQEGFTADELRLRVNRLVQRKQLADTLRSRVNDGLKAVVTDPLTGVYNRRYAMPHLQRIADEAARSGKSFAVMLIDLDRFKRVNDTHGHAAGDTVLVEVANRLAQNLRGIDLLARIGGEEFLIVMPQTDPIDAEEAAQRLRRVVCDNPVTISEGGTEIPVSISIGVALSGGTSSNEFTPGAIMTMADKALYGAKNDGRNQVIIGSAAA